MKKYRVAIDLDGVLLNFTKAACARLGLEYPKNTLLDSLDLYKLAGGKGKFWKIVNGHDFWSSLEKFPWSDELIKIVNDNAEDWVFLTKAAHDPFCYSGKFATVQRYWPRYTDKIWIVNGSKARFCRGEFDLLIDDKLKNCGEWSEVGGSFYHWNEVTEDYDVSYSLDVIKRLIK